MNQTGAGVEVFVFKGRRFLGSRCFSNNAIVIGSSPRATLKLRDPAVSERHAIVRVEGGQIVIADNDSNTGVFVNGARINTRTVSSFDEIAIGPFRMKLSLLGGAEEEDPGFGGEDELPEPATTVRRMDDVAPSPYARTEAELQGVALPQHRPAPHDPYETDIATHADSPAARARVLGGGLAPAPSADDGFEEFGEVATKRSPRGAALAASQAARRTRDALPLDGLPLDGAVDEEPPAPRERRRRRAKPAAKAKAKARRPAPAAWDDESLPGIDGQDQAGLGEDDDDLGLLGAEPEEPLPPDPGPPPDADDEDEDEDEESFVEPFSLLENIVRERFKGRADLEDHSSTEVIRYKDGEILDLLQADPGATVSVGLERFRLVNVHESGHAQLFFDSSFSGTVVSGGKARAIKRLRSEKYLVDRSQRIFGVELSEGDYAQLLREDGGYLVRFVRPPRQPRARDAGFRINWNAIQMFIGSAAFHLLMLVVMGFASPSDELRVDGEAERFAKIALKDVELEKAVAEQEQPKQEEPKVDEPQPQPTKKPPPPPKRPKRIVRRPRNPTPGPPSPAKQQAVQRKQVKNVLSALQNLKPADGPGRSDLKALASNIAAVRVPGGGSSSDFRIAGVIKKIPGGGVRLGGGLGGGGGKGTRSGSQLLRGTGIGNLKAAAGTGTRVRGRVRRAPKRAIQATGGHLSREAIQKVVSEHMHEVQACYERQLISNPGMAGKIVFDWVITPSGSVGSARQVSSSMRSPAVSSCILRLIRGWRFPQPVGGSVNVRYPFVFRVQGF